MNCFRRPRNGEYDRNAANAGASCRLNDACGGVAWRCPEAGPLDTKNLARSSNQKWVTSITISGGELGVNNGLVPTRGIVYPR